MSRRHWLGSPTRRSIRSRQGLQVIDQIVQVLSGEPGPSRHLVVQRISPGIDAGDDRRFDSFAVKGGVTTARNFMVVPLGIHQSREGNIRSHDPVHRASTPCRPMAHRTPNAFHPMAVFNDASLYCRAIHKNSPTVVSMGDRDEGGADDPNQPSQGKTQCPQARRQSRLICRPHGEIMRAGSSQLSIHCLAARSNTRPPQAASHPPTHFTLPPRVGQDRPFFPWACQDRRLPRAQASTEVFEYRDRGDQTGSGRAN